MKRCLLHLSQSPVGNVISRLFSLLIIFLLLASAAVWTGSLLGRPIGGLATVQTAQSAAPPDAAILSRLITGAPDVQLVPLDSAAWTVTSPEGRLLGHIVCSGPYAQEVRGFAGPTPLYIYVDTLGLIVSLQPGDNAETPGFMQRAAEGTLPHWQGLTPEAGAALKVDAVSGATFSSRALIANVQAALRVRAEAANREVSSPAIGWPRTFAVLAVLLTGIYASLRLRGRKGVRHVVLALNVLVLGFWSGQFLSLSLLRGWIANGLDPIAVLPTLALLLVAVVMPFFGRRHHYCHWVCPYGSLQELTSLLPLPRIHCTARTLRVMSHIRLGALSLLLLLLWTGLGGWLLDYEPFTAFLITSVPPVVLVLAAVFLIASCFVPRLWCRSLCPVGMLLDLAEKGATSREGNKAQRETHRSCMDNKNLLSENDRSSKDSKNLLSEER